MGGHGGLNILPQKRWNVYNFENREKVRKDEEAAAREEEANRAETRRRDSESRLQQLRQARGIETPATPTTTPPITSPVETESDIVAEPEPLPELKSDPKHINLFEGIKIFDPVEVKKTVREDEEDEKWKKKKAKKEEVRVVGPEDEKYRLGYGVAGKGVKAPWYATRPVNGYVEQEQEQEQERKETGSVGKTAAKTKKTIEELREERLKREKAEKERVRALLSHKHKPRDRERRHR